MRLHGGLRAIASFTFCFPYLPAGFVEEISFDFLEVHIIEED